MRKIVALLLAGVMTAGLAACGGASSSSTSEGGAAASGERYGNGGAEQVALAHGGEAVSPGGHDVKAEAAGGVGDGVHKGRATAVEELYGGVCERQGAAGHAAADGGGQGRGREAEVYVGLLHTGDLETGAVIQTEQVLPDLIHYYMTSWIKADFGWTDRRRGCQ